jgi:hypothetical protein
MNIIHKRPEKQRKKPPDPQTLRQARLAAMSPAERMHDILKPRTMPVYSIANAIVSPINQHRLTRI